MSNQSHPFDPLDASSSVSIIVPYGNTAPTLEQCVRALQTQDYVKGSIVIVLVNNGSADRSSEIAAQFPDLVHLREKNTSVYAARNRGARAATGELLLFTQPDCIAEPDWVEKHVERLISTHASVSVGRLAPIEPSWLLSTFQAYESVRDDWNFGSGRWKQYFGRPANIAIRRECFESHGPFVEIPRGADSLFVQQVAREMSCDAITFCSAAVVKHLALDGMGSYLWRLYRDSRIMSSLHSSHSAPIRVSDRARLFRQTTCRQRYNLIRSGVLLCLLILGVLAWKAGQWSAAIWPTTNTEI